jgi:hypothetical protein
MGWLKRMRAAFLPRRGHEASAAVAAANESHDKAVGQRDAMTRLRAEADEIRAEVRAHNEANRFDDFLLRVMRGHG